MGGLITKRNVSKALIADQMLRQNVPETEMYSKSVFKIMLGKYKMVYIKPNRGTGGKGVIRAQKVGPDQCKYQLQTTTNKVTSSDNLINSLELELQDSSYVIQRGIHLLRHNKRLYDLRIMVRKNLEGQWETTVIIGRLGHPAKIVTNVCKGGVSKPVEVLLKEHVMDIPAYVKMLKSLGYRTALNLNQSFPKLKELGLDVGIDLNLHPWILEANPRPAIYRFKTLKDKSIYKRICSYQQSYGRK